MSVTSKDSANPQFLTGTFTSAGSAADVTETLPWAPSLFILFVDIEGTNPNMVVQSAYSTTDSMLTTGSTGVITTPAVASGITISTTLNTVLIDSAAQVNSGKNAWIAFK